MGVFRLKYMILIIVSLTFFLYINEITRKNIQACGNTQKKNNQCGIQKILKSFLSKNKLPSISCFITAQTSIKQLPTSNSQPLIKTEYIRFKSSKIH